MGLLVAAAIVIVLIILISVGLFFYLGSRKPVGTITVAPVPSTSSPTPVTSPAPAPTTSSAPTVAEVRIPDPPPSVSSTTVDPVRTPEPPAAPVTAVPSLPPQVAGLALNSSYPIKVDLGTYFTPSGSVINAGGGSPVGWKIQAGSQPGTVRLQAPDGRYATYCNRCNPSIVKADQVTLTTDASATSDWVPVRAADGSYGFSNAGRFMTRCNGCGVVPNSITAHETGANGWSSSFRLG